MTIKSLVKRVEKLESEQSTCPKIPFILYKYGKPPNESKYKGHILTKEECRETGCHNIEVVKQMRLAKADGHDIMKWNICFV